nr:MAG TPA: hypothetical protein [Caudoviricetes sp.]
MRLIDADALWERLDNEPWFDNADRDEIALPFVSAAPTIDAEIVVRCKDCKYHYDCGVHFCDRLGMDCPDDSDFFCSYGERKNGGDNNAAD